MAGEVERHITTDDGVSLWVRDVGDHDRPAVLCCHGGPGVGDYLEPVEDALTPEFRVIRWDQRGSGRSEPVGPFTVDRFVADVDQVKRAAGLDRFVILGHSWGANLAMHYTIANPEQPSAVVHIAGTGVEWWPRFTTVHKENQLKRLGPAAGERMVQLRAADRSADEDRELRLLYIRSELHDTDDLATAERIHAAEQELPANRDANAELNQEASRRSFEQQIFGLHQVQCPVLMIHGASDPRPVEAVASMLTTLPNVEIEIMAGAGHNPWIEQPDQLWARVRSFLRPVFTRPA